MADLGDLFKQADETVRAFAQQAVDLYHQLPPEVSATVGAATAIAGVASAVFGWWSRLRNIFLRIFFPRIAAGEKPVTAADLEKAVKLLLASESRASA